MFFYSSCKDEKSQENGKSQIEQIDQLEDDDSFAGSSKRDDICQLLKEDDIRLVFDLSDAIEIKQEKDRDAICSYNWEASGEKFMKYTVMLNFASGGKRTKSQMDKAWEQQNKTVYSKRNMQSVSGVGDRASWSDLGGGQLRVAADGYIFYVSHSVMVMPGEDKPKDTQGMIDKTKILAKKIIERT
ncbi:hypothetical protein RBU60_10180 [Mesonia sp. MT50]|uniref:Lipoprotein n=1 Tax=Mesonia profundi TaxID=3070998 RepID=A0ABU1A2L3_9FLAO|nr:hypothetical protein [Mesonia profundi]MDQ7917943.1 hypothetical protein [Mesonia profundi]